MNIFSVKIKVLDLLIALFILSVLVVVVYFAFDPRQSANKKYDATYGPTATTIQREITDQVSKLDKKQTASVGFAKGSEVLKSLGLYDTFSNDTFIIQNLDNFFIGKEKGETASFYVCYIPKSEFLRDSRCNDSFVYTLNNDGTRSKVNCDVKSTWQTSSDPWVICSPN